MNVTILYFAAVRDVVGTSEERRSLPADVTTVRALVSHLVQAHPRLVEHLDYVRIARNETFVGTEEPVTEGDVIALLPPFSGG